MEFSIKNANEKYRLCPKVMTTDLLAEFGIFQNWGPRIQIFCCLKK